MVTGICGGIGSGKSVVSRLLRLRGYDVYDCDMEARGIMASSREIREAMENRWPAMDIYAGGEMDRAKVAAIVFADAAERAWLDSMVHGRVREHLAAWIAARSGERVFVESAILFSSGLWQMCNDVWEVTAPEDLRIRRIMTRSGMDAAQAADRIGVQRGEETHSARRNVTIHNIVNDGLHSLLREVELAQKKENKISTK